MAENRLAWRSGANEAEAARIISGVANMIAGKPQLKPPKHVSEGLSKLAESLKAEGADPKWRARSEEIQSKIGKK